MVAFRNIAVHQYRDLDDLIAFADLVRRKLDEG